MNAKILKQNKFQIAICVTKNKKDKPIHTGYFSKIKDWNKEDVLLLKHIWILVMILMTIILF
ncbi:hypothetical protein [Aquimarina sp. Aq78]|uniref:hypothetical protein n=1 Tax=Aquimarina sp. Aq78 TaxID=1191889 RepID=UPI000D0F8F03|nr:hypothetical protein [Aquimarina sp. Aq78]